MSTGRPTGRPPKDAQARSELRGRGRVQIVHAVPTEHGRLVAGMRAGDLVGALTTAAEDATWLRLADLPALILARQIAAALTPVADSAEFVAAKPDENPPPTDEVGTLPAFPTLERGGRPPPPRHAPARGPAPLRDLAPMLVGLLSDLGMTPQARVRLSITLVEEPEPQVPRPARMPRSAQ